MALLYRIMASSSQALHVSQECHISSLASLYRKSPEEWMSSDTASTTASLERGSQSCIHFRRLRQKGKENLPPGQGRDKTELTLRVILPNTWVSSSLLLPPRGHLLSRKTQLRGTVNVPPTRAVAPRKVKSSGRGAQTLRLQSAAGNHLRLLGQPPPSLPFPDL